MRIDIKDQSIRVENSNTGLKGHQKLQLGHWGFIRDKEQGSYILDDLDRLSEVMDYLKKENVNLELSSEAQVYLQKTSASLKKHEAIVTAAHSFKEGKIDKSNYNHYMHSIDANIHRALKEHQKKAVYHLSLVKNGANFSVPGSGKTSVVLAYFSKLREEQKINTLFVVGPPACFAPWQNEFKEVIGNKPKAKILAGLNKDARLFTYLDVNQLHDLYLTTFQTLLNDSGEIKDFLSSPEVSALVVVDEAHYMKRLDGDWANAVLNIAKAASYRCVLTGTPIPKSYTDIFNLMEFLWPDRNPLKARDKAQLRNYEDKGDLEGAADLLDSKVGSLFYRVRKEDLGLKPQVFRKPTFVKMHRHERTLYDAVMYKIRSYAQQDYLENIDLVTKLRRGRMIRARQSVSYARLLSSVLEDYREDLTEESRLKDLLINYDNIERPAKIDTLLSMVKNLQSRKQKVVIWSNFLGTIDLIQATFTSEDMYSKQITGSVPIEREKITSEETREKIRNEFMNPASGLDILIANPAACAESISLHKTCHHAIYYDLSYNLAQYLQSLDRIHRVGASERQEAYYDFLIYENTIDAGMLESLNHKADKMYRIINKDYGIYSLDMSELDEDEEREAYERILSQDASS